MKKLSKRDREQAIMAICAYALDEEIIPLSGPASVMFLLVKPTLDSGRKKAANGKQGGSKPKANGKQNGTEKEEEKEEEKEKEIEGEKEKKQPAIKEGRSFTLFWDDYPNKIDRNDAWEAWKTLNPDAETVGKIKAGLDAWKRSSSWLDDGGRYIPSAAKWLTKRRWECPPSAPANAQDRQLDAEERAAIQRMMELEDTT